MLSISNILPHHRLTPINYQISYDAYKEFVDAQGVTQVIVIVIVIVIVTEVIMSLRS